MQSNGPVGVSDTTGRFSQVSTADQSLAPHCCIFRGARLDHAKHELSGAARTSALSVRLLNCCDVCEAGLKQYTTGTVPRMSSGSEGKGNGDGHRGAPEQLLPLRGTLEFQVQVPWRGQWFLCVVLAHYFPCLLLCLLAQALQ